jgi:hypothetical protein
MSGRDAAKTTFFRRPVSQRLSFLQIFCTQRSKVGTLNMIFVNFQPFGDFRIELQRKLQKVWPSLPELPYVFCMYLCVYVCMYVCTRTTAHVIILEFCTRCLCCTQQLFAVWQTDVRQNKHCSIMRDFRLSPRRSTDLSSAGLLFDAGWFVTKPRCTTTHQSEDLTAVQNSCRLIVRHNSLKNVGSWHGF